MSKKNEKEISKRDEELEDEDELDDEEETDDEVEDEEDEDKETDKEDDEEKKIQSQINKKVEELSTKIAERVASKFYAGLKDNRKKIFENGRKERTKEFPSYKEQTVEFFKAVLSGDTTRAKTLTTSTADTPKAGYLVPPAEFMSEVYRIAEEYGIARKDMRYLPFTGSGNSRQVPALGTSVSVYWTNEKAKKTGTEPTFSLVTQTLKKLAAIVPFTEEELEDSGIDLYSLLVELFAEAIAKEEDTQFFCGSGSPWTGIIKNGSVQVVNMGTGEGFSSVNADDLLDMTSKVKKSVRSGAKFYMHTTIMDVVRKLKDSQGNYIYQQPAGDAPGKIWGYAIEELDVMPALTDSAASTAFILFGNLKKTCIMGDKQKMRVKLLEEGTITDTDGETAVNLAEQDVLALRIVERVGYVLALPAGVCVLKSGVAS